MRPTTGHLIERAADRLREAPQRVLTPASPTIPVEQAPQSKLPESAPGGRPALPLTIEAMQAAGLAVVGGRSRAIEEWRIVAASLLRTQPADGRPLSGALMVTSSQPAEGKSFCSLNLAATVARNGLRSVLLIDLDYKPRALSSALGMDKRTGLLDLARQPGFDVARMVVPTAIPQLDILPLGRRSSDGDEQPTELTQAVVATIERVARRYSDRLLILDMPPCLATSDAATLAPHVGQIAMVVEAGRTQRTELEAALGLLDTCEAINLVLNKSRARARGHFGGDYYGHYGYYGGR